MAEIISLASSWPTTNVPPGANPGVRLIFTGMVIFTFKKTSSGNEGRAVFHRGTANHHLRIQVLEDCKLIYALGGGVNPVSIHEMEIGISDRDPNVDFFQSDMPFHREIPQGNAKDFRWLLDLEGPDFHNGKFKRTESVFSTKLKVKQGTFYTYKHTGHYFKCDRGVFQDMRVGYVPKVIAADIPLDGGCVSLKIDGHDVLPYRLCDGNARYEIYFSNECEENCPEHGDFEMVFDAVNISANERFNLVAIGGLDNGPTDDLCLEVPFEEAAHHLTDEAPCMGSGFGGGGGFP